MWSQRKEFVVTLLRQRMLEDLQIRHYSPTTIRLYLYAIKEFAKHFGKPPDQLGAEHIRRYQLFLTKEKKVSTSTYVLMVCALRFFYTHTLHRKVAIERIPFPRREGSFRLRSMNSIGSAPARPFRCTTPSFRRSPSDRIRFIIGSLRREGSFRSPFRGKWDNFPLRPHPGTYCFKIGLT